MSQIRVTKWESHTTLVKWKKSCSHNAPLSLILNFHNRSICNEKNRRIFQPVQYPILSNFVIGLSLSSIFLENTTGNKF